MSQEKENMNDQKDNFWYKQYRKVNIFFRRIDRKEVLTFLLFLLLSAFFWIVETAYEENDSTYRVRLIIENQPANKVFTTHVPADLQVSIKDNNFQLFNYNYNHRIDSLVVDFNRYADVIGNFRISGAELQALLLSQLLPSTQITAISPSLIDAKFAITDGKMLPVVLNADFTAAPNCRCMDAVIKPDSVLVHAPSEILDTMTCIRTEFISQYNMSDTLRQTVKFDVAIGVKTNPESVAITIPVSKYVEKVFDSVEVKAKDVPEGSNLVIFPSHVRISCLVDFSLYKTVEAADFDLSVSYDSIKSEKQKYIDIDIISKADPKVVSNIQIEPSSIEYIIEDNK